MSTVQNIFNPQVVYATDRSKAVVPVLFFILCSFVVYTTRRLMCWSLLVLFCPRFFVCFSILITSRGEEGAGLCFFFSHLFVCFERICVCHFSLPLGVEGSLRFVIVAYLGPFY